MKVMHVNVGHIGPAHDTCLNLAWEEAVDVVLIQDPWASLDNSRRKTKTHPGYNTFTPHDDWTGSKPGVLTYTRKGLRASQLRLTDHPDICWVKIGKATIGNIYRRPRDTTVLDKLEALTIKSDTLIAGDWNAVNWTWQPGHERHPGPGTRIAEWAEKHNLSPATDGLPTRDAGFCIDLGFTNIDNDSRRRLDLDTGSDHSSILIQLQTDGQRLPPGRTIVGAADIEDFQEAVGQSIWTLPEIRKDKQSLDEATEALEGLLIAARDATGRPAPTRGRGASWWDQECRDAREIYKKTKDADTGARKRYREIIAGKKRAFWEKVATEGDPLRTAFMTARWQKQPDAFQAPPLRKGEEIFSEPKDKAEHLREEILLKWTARNDYPAIPPEIREPGKRHIPFHSDISPEEVKKATIGAGNTAPGRDGIGVRLLASVWDKIGTYVTKIFKTSLQIGYWPRTFKHADVTFIPKVGKPDYTKAKAWRPISLLSCLGKGLERIVAWKLGSLALKHKVLSNQQISALPGRSALDIVLCAVHDVEQALNQGLAASIMLADVAGAFNAVLKNRLAARLQDQGWDPGWVRWIYSFISDRECTVKTEQGEKTETKTLEAGAPQGSPLSPILFMLYIEPVFKRREEKTKFGYADDLSCVRIGKTHKETSKQLQADLDDILEWGKDNAVDFEADKTELIHFARSKGKIGRQSIRHNGKAILPSRNIRWLGMILDSQLTFKEHVQTWGSKALKTANHLRRLLKGTARPTAYTEGIVARSCVLPVALYGAEIWWEGTRKESRTKGGETVETKQKHLLTIIDRSLRMAARNCLPVWSTTPNAAVHREAHIPPAVVAVEQARLRLGARIRQMGGEHPVAIRADQDRRKGKGGRPTNRPPRVLRTRLERARDLAPEIVRPREQFPVAYPTPRKLPSKEKEAAKAQEAHKRTLGKKQLQGAVIVYTDGSKAEDGDVGWGYYISHDDVEHTGNGGLGDQAEVFDGEAKGLVEGLKAGAEIARRAGTNRVVAFLDNQAVIHTERKGKARSSYLEFEEIWKLKESKDIQFGVHWVQGHAGIPGNEKADHEAGEGAKKEGNDSYPTAAKMRSLVRRHKNNLSDDYWYKNQPRGYKDLGLDMSKIPQELKLPGPTLHRLIAERTGHGDFREYHDRFHHDKEPTCKCGKPKEVRHVLTCERIWGNPEVGSLAEWQERLALLGDKKGGKNFAEFLKKHNPYET